MTFPPLPRIRATAPEPSLSSENPSIPTVPSCASLHHVRRLLRKRNVPGVRSYTSLLKIAGIIRVFNEVKGGIVSGNA